MGAKKRVSKKGARQKRQPALGGAAARRTPQISVTPGPNGLVANVVGERPLLSTFLPGDQNKTIREEIIATGAYRPRNGREVRVMTRELPNGEHEIMHMAATVSRSPGTTQDVLGLFDDFGTQGATTKSLEVAQMWTIYDNVGMVNSSVNKIAALMSAGGSFKVRHAKKGKKQKAREELQTALDEVNNNVNNAPLDGVVTGTRGLKAITQQGVRQALVESDWFGREFWMKHQVRDVGSFSLPMLIQSISTANMEPITEIQTSGLEAWYWKPDSQLVQQLTNPKDAVVRDLLKKYVDSKTLAALKRDGKVFLDQSLLLHAKHRGKPGEPYGESFVKPALYAVAYKRAVEQLDLVVINSLINRLTIVMVGSADPNSPYSDPTVAAQRQALMQSFFDDTGPNMTIVWQGDDVDVKDVGAHNTVLDLDGRHEIAGRMVKEALGVPDALLTGSSADGKASAFASLLSVGSALDEIKSSFEQIWSSLGQRIAEENGFTDAEVIYEFDNSQLIDKTEERNQARLDYTAGTMSIRSMILSRGQDPDAEFRNMCEEKGLDPETALWAEAFAPPLGLPGQGAAPPGRDPSGAPPAGRPPDSTTGNPTSAPKEKKKPDQNK